MVAGLAGICIAETAADNLAGYPVKLLRQYQLAVTGNAQAVIFTVVYDDYLIALRHQLLKLNPSFFLRSNYNGFIGHFLILLLNRFSVETNSTNAILNDKYYHLIIS